MNDGTRPYQPGEERESSPQDRLTFPEPDQCPVRPLGRRQMVYYFFARSGEIVSLSHKDVISQGGIRALFDGDVAWLRQYVPFRGEKEGSIAWPAVGGWLMRLCADEGLWDPNTPVRGPGVWRGDAGGIMVHAGDSVFDGEDWRPAGCKIGRILYPAAPAVPRPAPKIATAEDGQRLLAAAQLWRYEEAIGPDLVVGQIGAAALGGAPDHRAHMLITGRFGSGKSWLADLISGALGAGAQPIGNDVTPASLYQAFTGEARALILDESEENRANGRVAAVIELLRRMSTGEGALVSRGSAGGKSVRYHVTGCAILAATLPPALKPQDRSRITLVRLRQLEANMQAAGASDRAQKAIAWASRMSPAFRARAIAHWTRFCDTFEVYRTRFLELGMQPRDCNQAAVLLAGRDLLCADDVPQGDALLMEVDRFAPMIEWAAENQDEGEGQQALNRLLTYPVDLWRSGDRLTVGELIWRAYFDDTRGWEYRKKLPSLGLRAEGGTSRDPARSLWVARRHDFLRRVYQGSNWEDRWTEGLRELEGAGAGKTAARFAGALERYTILPDHWLPVESDPAFSAGGSSSDKPDGPPDPDPPPPA